jgi:hypothetical protein
MRIAGWHDGSMHHPKGEPMPTKLYEIAGATGLFSIVAMWVLLHYFRIGGTPFSCSLRWA